MPGVEPCRPKWFHIVLCLIMTTSCSLKTGIQNLSNYNQPLGIDEEPLRYWEGEVYTPRLIADHADLVFGIGYNAGKEEGSIEVDEFSPWPKVESHLWDLRLGTRLFPLGVRDRTVIPYVSGGIGYYEYDVETNTPTDDIDGAWFQDHYGVDKRSDTLAHGYFLYLSTGLYLALDKRFMLQMEFRYDHEKDYNRYDLSGSQITVGFAFMHE